MIEMELCKVIYRENGDDQFVFLREKAGKQRSFPIVIGRAEVREIWNLITKFEPPRPLTHQLLKDAIQALGATVERIVVNNLEKGTYYARIILSRNGETIELDARPSDALALATRLNAPIFASEHVVDRATS
ncbi:MAG: bifunctional nuclease family protein [Planctomycetes bacterium]|nr:bifunctional nuclease family protein [Planctomycetota bacterium]